MRVPARERAQGLVEFAVIFPIFAFFLFAIIDGGLAMSRFQTMGGAAREGARYGAVGADATAIATRTAENAHGLLDPPGTGGCGAPTGICVQWVAGPSGESPGAVGSSVMVNVRYQYTPITPLIGLFGLTGPSWTIKGCAMQRVERAVGSAVPTATPGTTC